MKTNNNTRRVRTVRAVVVDPDNGEEQIVQMENSMDSLRELLGIKDGEEVCEVRSVIQAGMRTHSFTVCYSPACEPDFCSTVYNRHNPGIITCANGRSAVIAYGKVAVMNPVRGVDGFYLSMPERLAERVITHAHSLGNRKSRHSVNILRIDPSFVC